MNGKPKKEGNVGQQMHMKKKDQQRKAHQQQGPMPVNRLNAARNKQVLVNMKSGARYRGKLNAWDIHLNLVIDEAEHAKPNEENFLSRGGAIVIRGDGVQDVLLPGK